MKERYHLAVIGGGPGGYSAAVEAAKRGLTVAVIENRELGGTCLNRGCIPTKTLLHAADLCREIKKSEAFGLHVGGVEVDIHALYERKNDVILTLRGGIRQLLEKNKVDILQGEGMILSAHTVLVRQEDLNLTVEADNILIATGSKPARLSIEGMALPSVITSDELLSMSDTLFQRLVIIGGGVIGVEFASVFSAFGSEVTIIEGKDRILPTMDREISQNLSMILKKRGISIHTGANVKRIVKDAELACVYEEKGAEQIACADRILVAVGRHANTDGLFGKDFCVDMERGGIVVNEKYQTNVPSIYAIGDVIHGGIQLAHVASAQGINAVAAICKEAPEADTSVIPLCVYTDPEIASVGITADDAKAGGLAVKIGKAVMSANGKSVLSMQERGFIKLVFSTETDVLLGAQLMCARATDLVSELSMAIVNRVTASELSMVIRPHPTISEAVSDALYSLRDKAGS